MNENECELRNAALLLIDREEYTEALRAIDALPERIKGSGRMLIAKADCFYEMAEDLSALEYYVKYLTRFPDGRGKNFALVGAAMVLKNLNLQSEAKAVLELVDDTHLGKEKELLHSAEILEQQRKAKELLGALGIEL